MKAKCEEIIIDQYLMGNISNEFKSKILAGFSLIKEDNYALYALKELFRELQTNPIETLKIGQKLVEEQGSNLKEELSKHNFSFEELSFLVNELIKEDVYPNNDEIL